MAIDMAARQLSPGTKLGGCRFSRNSTADFSRMFVMGRTRFPGLGGALIGEGAVL